MNDYNFQADFSKFNPDTMRYTGENALFLTDCAKLAYKPEASIKKVMDELELNNFKFFTGPSTQAYIAGNDKMIIVAFRGTEMKVKDFLADTQLKPEPGPVGKVHRVFQDALREVWADMRNCIDQFQDNNQSVWFCGHSLGAALATLAAAEYVLKDRKVAHGIYTIGQPRVGDEDFAAGFDAALAEKCFRFVNNNDVVTQNPLPGLVFKYAHVGQKLYIDSNGILRSTIPWWKKLWDQWNGIKVDVGDFGIDALRDHGSEGYVALINNNRAVSTPWS